VAGKQSAGVLSAGTAAVPRLLCYEGSRHSVDACDIITSVHIQGGPIKNVSLYLYPYLRQLLTGFQ